jgi:hypothetical protein
MIEVPILIGMKDVDLEFGTSWPVNMTGVRLIVPTAGSLVDTVTSVFVSPGNSGWVLIAFRVTGSRTAGKIVSVVAADVVVVLKVVPNPEIANPDGSTVIVPVAEENPGTDAVICVVPGAVEVP